MRKILLLFQYLFLISLYSYSQELTDHSILVTIDSMFSLGENEKAFPGLSASYVSADTTWIGTYGVRKWNEDDAIDATTRFQLGSVGKILTAIAVLQQHDKGRLSLDQDVQTYLDFSLKTVSTTPITLRDLLSHSAGMNDKNIGYLSMDSSQQQSLEDHLINQLPSFYQNPGIEISYSNYSYALAGLIVEKVSGISFRKYVETKILLPLDLSDSFVGFDYLYGSNPQYAIGHAKSDQSFEVNKEYARSAIPAGSFISNASDMSRFMLAIISRDTTILSKETWNLLFERNFTNHDLLSGYSLGLEEQQIGGTVYWAKGGMLFGYLSQVIFLTDSSALFIAQNSTNDDFLEGFHAKLRGILFDQSLSDVANEISVNLENYAGEYRDARYDREGVENIISLFKGAFNVWIGKESLSVWHNGKLHNYIYQGDHVFVNKNNSDEKMVFSVDESGKALKLFRNVNIGGIYVPATYEKTSWYNSPTFVNEYYGIVLIVILVYGVISLFMMIVFLIQNWKSSIWKWQTLPKRNHLVALLGIGVVGFHISKAILMLIKNTKDFLFGLPDEFVFYNGFAYAIPIFTLLLWILLVKTLTSREGTLVARSIYTIFTIAFTTHALALNYWNFI